MNLVAADTTTALPESAFIPKTHISLNVKDVERSVAFYEAFFGQPVHKRRPGYANFDIAYPPLKLALNELAPVDQGTPRLSHLGIQVGTEIEVNTTRERLETSGVVMFNEGDTVCCYARQDKVWVTDPDGNSWEVYVLLDEMDDVDDHHFNAQGKAEASACCEGISARTIKGKQLTVGAASCC